jgi:hypothetical protein|tara:strand:- start:4 stop:426 length:423 start_codon:yes stop_codon:yes gene_type:complete
MRTMIAILLFAPILVSGQENSTEKFVELNIGVATIDSYSFDDGFPGGSFLWGQTRQISDNRIFEHQVGFAFPSLVTGKLAYGIGNLQKYIAIAVRPWPLSVGPQAKIGRLSLSFEVGTNDGISADAGFISTIAYRWTIGR